ncbi:HlyD family efflux transporter periplasmic adaptor subunit [Caldimonas brevitalea]|uniref:Multidrug resistance efflux pump n=1 Tax=Caldimonas brevitalea TaxID=413882 RepID=A0A0G3BQX2_9BURK|nr:HlyD family efflux transporter periplasmic adaptor subunit [Caldimonas brevitalea]AKJ31814.1 hypothetical protein AAW51_5123 [Caldimonas brevitalea]
MKIQFDAPPGSAQESNGLAVRYAAAKRSVPRWRWRLLLALVIAPPLYFVGRFLSTYWWETAPGFVLTQQVTLRAGAEGRVATLLGEGASVQGQQALGLLEPPEAPAPVAEAASAAPAPAVAPRPDPALTTAVRLAQRQLALRRERLGVVERLASQGAATAAEVQTAQAQLLQAEAEVMRARSDATPPAPPAPPPPAPPAAARPAFGPPIGTAPFTGTVVRVLVRPGEWVSSDSEVAVVRGGQAPRVRAYVEPGRARYAEIGRRATLRFLDGGRIGATVAAVAPEAARLPAERVSPLTPRSQSIVVELQPDVPLPEHYRVHYLPLDVRFDHLW